MNSTVSVHAGPSRTYLEHDINDSSLSELSKEKKQTFIQTNAQMRKIDDTEMVLGFIYLHTIFIKLCLYRNMSESYIQCHPKLTFSKLLYKIIMT